MASSANFAPQTEAAVSKTARRTVLPIIPRALERKSGLVFGSTSNEPSSEVGLSIQKEVPLGVAAEQSNGKVDNGRIHSNGLDSESSLAEDSVPGSINGGKVEPAHMQKSLSQPSTTESSVRDETAPAFVPNGAIAPFYLPATAKLARLDNGIVFGTNEESIGSSPTIPPSAGSTIYTHPTPVSDNGPHFGYRGPPPLPAVNGFPKPPETVTDRSPIHHHSASHQSLSSAASNAGDIFRQPGGPGAFVNAANLPAYLVSQFDDPSFADCILDFDIRGDHLLLSAHSLIVARSDTLRHLLLEYGSKLQDGKRHISLSCQNAFITTAALRDAIRACYGAALPSTQRRLLLSGVQGDYEGSASSMRAYLADLAVGQLLEIFDVSAAAATCIREIVSLGNVEELLAFILTDSPGITDYRTEDGLHAPPLARTNVQGPWTFELISAASNVILAHMNNSFVLDVSAPPALLLGGFPAPAESPRLNNGSLSNGHHKRGPSVMGIRFGDFPSAPDAATTTTSSLLLSLPYNFLRHILLLSRPPYAADIVAERERRRLAYCRSFLQYGDAQDPLPPAACWKEIFDAAESDIRREWDAS